MRKINMIIIHCSDTPPSMDIGAAEIDRWHRERGWSGIGYHWVIRRSGQVEKGRPEETQGAHTYGQNNYSIGVCLIGGMTADRKGHEANYTPEQWRSLESIVRGLLSSYPGARLYGHRDFSPDRACPVFDVKEWWATITTDDDVPDIKMIRRQMKEVLETLDRFIEGQG